MAMSNAAACGLTALLKPEELGMKEGDTLLYSGQASTLDHLLLVTNKGNVIYRPIHELPDLKWKDLGNIFRKR